MSGARSASIRLPRRRRWLRRGRLPRPGLRALIAVAAIAALAAGGWVWLRNSSLVSVQRVTIVGVSGRDAAQIRSALVSAARNMTTLDVKMSALRTAVAPFPVVKRLRVFTDFPHHMRIEVEEQVPVALISADGVRVAVSADGTLLHGASAPASLPTISLGVSPGGTHVDGSTLQVVRLLAAAPYQLLAKVGAASSDPSHGLEAQLRNGPRLYFGSATQLEAKWSAAAAVLADPGSAGAAYIDVTVPSRPAAGAGAGPNSAATSGGGGGGAPSSGSSATTGAAGGG